MHLIAGMSVCSCSGCLPGMAACHPLAKTRLPVHAYIFYLKLGAMYAASRLPCMGSAHALRFLLLPPSRVGSTANGLCIVSSNDIDVCLELADVTAAVRM